LSTNTGKLIDFEVIREPWHKYELNDNTIIKTKYVLTTLNKTQKDEKPNYAIDGQAITVVLPAVESKGPQDPAQYTGDDYKKAIIQDDVKYNTLDEEWYEYIVDDGTKLKLKMTVIGISKTSKFNKKGDPVYIVNHGFMINVRLPKLE